MGYHGISVAIAVLFKNEASKTTFWVRWKSDSETLSWVWFNLKSCGVDWNLEGLKFIGKTIIWGKHGQILYLRMSAWFWQAAGIGLMPAFQAYFHPEVDGSGINLHQLLVSVKMMSWNQSYSKAIFSFLKSLRPLRTYYNFLRLRRFLREDRQLTFSRHVIYPRS